MLRRKPFVPVIGLLLSLVLTAEFLLDRKEVRNLKKALDLDEPSPSRETTMREDGICGQFMGAKSVDELWGSLRDTILKNSYSDTDFFNPHQHTNLHNNSNLTEWTRRAFDFFTIDRLHKTLVVQASFHPIVDILDRRLRDPQNAPSLQILAVGGSPTAGVGCAENPFLRLSIGGKAACYECAWPARIEQLLNAVFGADVVKVTNLAVGGQTSDLSAVLLEYGLWPSSAFSDSGPDLILWGHAVNDGLVFDESKILEGLTSFQTAANKLQRCNDHLPLVVYMDDAHGESNGLGGSYWRQQYVAQAVYRVSNYYQQMLVSQRNALRDYILSESQGEAHYYDLLGSTADRHPGFIHHVSIGWVLLYNFLHSMLLVCQSRDNVSSPSNYTTFPTKDAPSVIDSKSRIHELGQVWRENYQKRKAICSSSNNTVGKRCTYGWMSNRMAGIDSRPKLTAQLEPLLTFNEGWKADGFPIRSPKLGWDAKKNGAVFEIKILVETKMVNSLTVVVMESYGPAWNRATLQIDVTVLDSPEKNQTRSFNVTGYHEQQTSISVPHSLPISPAYHGQSVFVRCTLVSGQTFKILGLALCWD